MLHRHRRILVTLVATAVVAAVPRAAVAKTKGHKKKAAPSEAAAPAATKLRGESFEPPPATAVRSQAAATPAPATHATQGQIEYGPPGAGRGSLRITGDKMRIALDGRDFGVTPLIIHNVPRGDYVVEATSVDGRVINRPVSVDENTEATVDVGALSRGPQEPRAGGGSTGVPLASKISLGISAAALAAGITFGVLEIKARHDYESAALDQQMLDALARSGRRDALVANLAFLAGAASLVTAAAIALPSILRAESPEPAAPSAPSVALTAAPSAGGAMTSVSVRF